MLNKVKDILKSIGVDWSIAYSSGARIVQGFTGAVSIIFISTFLTGVEQGFYFTFGSITAIQVFIHDIRNVVNKVIKKDNYEKYFGITLLPYA